MLEAGIRKKRLFGIGFDGQQRSSPCSFIERNFGTQDIDAGTKFFLSIPGDRSAASCSRGRIAEQKRIVAKVDELMALVDRLEKELQQGQAVGKELMEAVVGEMVGV